MQISFGFILWLCSFELFAQIKVQSDYHSPEIKPGYHLIFRDEFDADTLNLRNWDISTSNLPDDSPCGFYDFDAMLSQVSVRDGACIIKAELATPQNSNCLLTPDCQRGIGGEIKTFTWREGARNQPDFAGHTFDNFDMPVGSYIEARLKVANPACNVGTGFWLSGHDQEIDVLETVDFGPHQFTCGYYSGRYVKGKYRDPYERNRNLWHKMSFQNGRFPKIVEGRHVLLPLQSDKPDGIKPQQKDSLQIHEIFVTYAVRYTADSLAYFLNDKEYFSYALADYKSKNRYLTEAKRKNIRFSVGQLTGSGHTPCIVPCSTQMEIDYVRVYLPVNQTAIAWFDNTTHLKSTDTQVVLKATYYPGVQYTWSSDAFLFAKEWDTAPEAHAVVTVRKGIQAGTYPIKLTCAFPDGHVEELERVIEVNPE
jgi:hypothetical protein